MYVPRTQHRPLAVTELVEHEQRVIARAPKVSVVRRSLLFSMYRTLRTVHVQDHPPVCRAGHSSVHPLSVHSAQPFDVAVLGKHLGLEPAHGVGAGGRSLRTTSPSNDYPHRRVLGQPFSVVGILVARQTTVHRLPEKAHQSVLHVTTAPTLLQTLIRRLRQSQCIVQLAAGQQPSVRGDGSAAKLQPYTSVETELGAGGWCFHPLGASEDSTLSRTRVVARDQSSTHDNHCALLFGYSRCNCYCLRHTLQG